jgi:HlyD family secretion protein
VNLVKHPPDLEVIIDVLSSDAVKVTPGNEIRLLHWGGEHNLNATVRVVEPAAFTKISALGVEEQRDNVIGDLELNQNSASRLGDGYRVEAEIVVWKEENVLQVPAAALFRLEGKWAVFVIENDLARIRSLQIGRRNALSAEVIDGLQAGENVIVYPSDLVADGVKVSRAKM